MAADPVRKLVRAEARWRRCVMLPALTLIGDVLGILGGLVIAVLQLDLTAGFYSTT